ncbi:hypothetical protein DXT89_01800 [Agrobacterium vitis]|uniref:Uncharacterized protein n=1 Tax=Agrobacterium vitis TaxID=373 RepID=A0A368NXE1_AGRVI|nr:hypothetical protein DXM22_01925 [Agrobacterium vitis]KAA3532114.1 hypothetical protein DXT89_01800 [Agrobacterium vitis]RCU55237.1 hypothetical protein ASB66_009945 [Agrobacterium vitis]
MAGFCLIWRLLGEYKDFSRNDHPKSVSSIFYPVWKVLTQSWREDLAKRSHSIEALDIHKFDRMNHRWKSL